MAYANYQDLTAALDANVVANLCSDSSTPLPGDNAVLQTLIGQAAGKINMAVSVAERYTAENMAYLESIRDPTLVRLTVDLTIGLLFRRRGREMPQGMKDQADEANATLTALANGARIFSAIGAASSAGLPAVSAVPTNLIGHYQPSYASPFFPLLQGQTYPGAGT